MPYIYSSLLHQASMVPSGSSHQRVTLCNNTCCSSVGKIKVSELYKKLSYNFRALAEVISPFIYMHSYVMWNQKDSLPVRRYNMVILPGNIYTHMLRVCNAYHKYFAIIWYNCKLVSFMRLFFIFITMLRISSTLFKKTKTFNKMRCVKS